MRRLIASGVLIMIVYAAVMVISTAIAAPTSMDGFTQFFSPEHYGELYGDITGDWQKVGQPFTQLQSELFWKIFLGVITVIPVVFLLHFLIVGAKSFAHDGPQILFFNFFTRIVHWIGAISFALLVITGLLIIFGAIFGGGAPIRLARHIHIINAMIFGVIAVFMFLIWVKDMFPTFYDIKWIFILGGYLSKKKKPVPAGKFNAGQKAWFWLATVGGGVMAYTGYIIWGMNVDLDTVRLYTIVHNVLGMVLISLFLTHLYMSLFAIKGSLHSMISGYKPKEEVDILHSRYKYE
ncbi:MAG: formate dehydrogenase subunit gamma [Desulfocapsaceae bacterium]